jgi:hypothetical protein
MRRAEWCLFWGLAFGVTLGAADARAQGGRRVSRKHALQPTGLRSKIVEIAGGRAYLAVGADDRIRVGDSVSVAGQRFTIVAVNRSTSAFELRQTRLKLGQPVSVSVGASEPTTEAVARARPTPLEHYQGSEFAGARPAETQHPVFVPLGVLRDTHVNYALLLADYALTAPLGGGGAAIGRTRLRGRLHWELTQAPLSFDLDAFTELWHAADLSLRRNNPSRPLLNVRQLEVGYHGDLLQAAGGRLRYAAATTGQLDGVRLSAELAPGLSLAAFGGTPADPLNGGLATDASRFGSEVLWRGRAPWQPQASLTLQGSSFQGSLDERRLLAQFQAFPKSGRIGARAEVQSFDRNNAWGASATELTALGADAAVAVLDSLQVSAAIDMARPERSRWLAAYLPAGFFCVATPQAGLEATELCEGGDRRYSGALGARLQQPSWVVSAGAQAATTERAEAENYGGFVAVRALPDLTRVPGTWLEAGASAQQGTFIDRTALDVSLGTRLASDALDAAVYYQPARARYRAGAEAFVEHGLGTRLWWSTGGTVDVQGSADWRTSADASVLFLYAGLAWRPRF